MNLLHKILWEGKSKWQVLGAAIGAFIGLLLMLTAVQLYFDLQKLLDGEANPNDQYVQVNKKVNVFNTFGVKSTFTEAEIEEIESQEFVQKNRKFYSESIQSKCDEQDDGLLYGAIF
jgi:hypothetical protein